ncbi:hypothetical protein ELBI_41 [Anabaena phage Elbi]|nr:hypothetical protein ELBI_41 [Anabaena phage Elbi]
MDLMIGEKYQLLINEHLQIIQEFEFVKVTLTEQKMFLVFRSCLNSEEFDLDEDRVRILLIGAPKKPTFRQLQTRVFDQ